MLGDADELHELENYLLTKSAEKVGTPIKLELNKLRQVAEERSRGLAQVLGISTSPSNSNFTGFISSPLTSASLQHQLNTTSPISFQKGMAIYRPGTNNVLSIDTEKNENISTSNPNENNNNSTFLKHCPPTPQAVNQVKRSKLIESDSENNSNSPLKSIPFTPARASAHGINLIERETCPKKLLSRQKQLDFGKNTPGYARYVAEVPRNQRKRGDHPWIPNKHQICSKRSWDGQVRKWRRALHKFDPDTPINSDNELQVDENENEEEAAEIASETNVDAVL